MAKKRGKKGKSRKSRKAKAKRQKFIRKISRDGKISKKEGKKAAKKGISLRKIRNRNIGDYRASVRRYEKAPKQNKAGRINTTRPTYEPLKIKRGAEQAYRKPPSRDTSPIRTQVTPVRSGNGDTIASLPGPFLPDQVVNAPQVDFQPFEPDMPDFQGMMEQQSADYQNQLDAMRAEQAAAAEEYRRQAEEQRRQFELQQRTMIGNEARAGQQASFQLGGAPGMKRGGTFGFRRRRRRMMGGIGASGLAGATAPAASGVFG